MFIRAIMSQTVESGKWNHRVNKHSSVVSLPMGSPTVEQCYNCTFIHIDNVSCFFMMIATRNTLDFSYSLEAFHGPGKYTREEGKFTNFDSVSAIFHGVRFHWSRESGKIIISDALASRRDFNTLTIE